MKSVLRSCINCKNRCYNGMFGAENCYGYEICDTDEEMVDTAKCCKDFVAGHPDCFRDTSSTCGDYGPGNPWDAPGMSTRDFI